MTRTRLLLLGAVFLAVTVTLWLLAGVWIAWSACCWLSPAWLVIGVTLMASLNLAALLFALITRSALGLWVLAGIEIGNIVFSLAASVAVSPAWLFDIAPESAILVMLVFWLARSKPVLRRRQNVTPNLEQSDGMVEGSSSSP